MAADALARSGLADVIRTNIYWSIAARAIELLHACAEARDLIDGYRRPAEPKVAWTSNPGRAAWATEAPRGLLFHRYEVDDRGLVAAAQIVPPTSQNQAAIESDLAEFAPSVLDLPHEEATLRLEQLIRSYDPCISCATHFLDLRVERST
jgi:coenzyme F420-reducing hydrogenase alpha subunit